MAKLYELKKDPGICLGLSDLAAIAGVAPSTMIQRIATVGVDKAILMKRQVPTPCLCGCGKLVKAGKYHSSKCATKHHRQQVENNELEPYDYYICKECGLNFPRYLSVYGKKPTIEGCCRSCRSKIAWKTRQEKIKKGIIKPIIRTCLYSKCDVTFEVYAGSPKKYCCPDHKHLAYAEQEAPQKKKKVYKHTEKNRRTFCIRKLQGYQVTCIHYDNWLSSKGCSCVGFTPPKKRDSYYV
jgi:hypothetical protein